MSAETIALALGGVPLSEGAFSVHCPVPTHGKGQGDSHPSLTVADVEGGRLRVHCFAGCSPGDVFEALRQRGLLEAPAPVQRVVFKDTREKALALYRQARDPYVTPVHRYLLGRGLDLTLEAAYGLRFHPACPFADRSRRPAMLAILRPFEGEWATFSGIIRTELLAAGGRGLRQSLGVMRGAAWKLGDDDGRLIVTEGIETAIACQMMFGPPVWALGSAAGVRWFPVLDGVEHLIISKERDPVGERSADDCARRWILAGRRVSFIISPTGKDLADHYREANHA